MGAKTSGPRAVGAVRVIAILLAVVTALYTAVAPSMLFFMSIGSYECLGSSCDAATRAVAWGALIAYLAGALSIIGWIILAVRPRRAPAVVAIAAALGLVAVTVVQAWGVSTLSAGRAAGSAATDLTIAAAEAAQQAVEEVTGLSIMEGADMWGPDIEVAGCPDGEPGFVAVVRLYFAPGVVVEDPAQVQAALTAASPDPVPPSTSLVWTVDWQEEPKRGVLEVRSDCQPLPVGS
jgi:hypothetical protein